MAFQDLHVLTTGRLRLAHSCGPSSKATRLPTPFASTARASSRVVSRIQQGACTQVWSQTTGQQLQASQCRTRKDAVGGGLREPFTCLPAQRVCWQLCLRVLSSHRGSVGCVPVGLSDYPSQQAEALEQGCPDDLSASTGIYRCGP